MKPDPSMVMNELPATTLQEHMEVIRLPEISDDEGLRNDERLIPKISSERESVLVYECLNAMPLPGVGSVDDRKEAWTMPDEALVEASRLANEVDLGSPHALGSQFDKTYL